MVLTDQTSGPGKPAIVATNDASGAGKPAIVATNDARCSLGTVAVGCPEHAQVGPLPRLSKSRQIGRVVGLADSGVPISCLLGKPHATTALWERLPSYESDLFGGTTRM